MHRKIMVILLGIVTLGFLSGSDTQCYFRGETDDPNIVIQGS